MLIGLFLIGFLHFMIVLDDENSTSVSRPRDVFLSIWYIRVLKKSSRISLLSIDSSLGFISSRQEQMSTSM